jgi:hypothetical protein
MLQNKVERKRASGNYQIDSGRGIFVLATGAFASGARCSKREESRNP